MYEYKMDIYRSRRDTLFNFIISVFSAEEFARSKQLGGMHRIKFNSQFGSYQDFVQSQRNITNSLDESTLVFAEQLMQIIKSNSMEVEDKENMIMFPLSGFIFHNGKFVMIYGTSRGLNLRNL